MCLSVSPTCPASLFQPPDEGLIRKDLVPPPLIPSPTRTDLHSVRRRGPFICAMIPPTPLRSASSRPINGPAPAVGASCLLVSAPGNRKFFSTQPRGRQFCLMFVCTFIFAASNFRSSCFLKEPKPKPKPCFSLHATVRPFFCGGGGEGSGWCFIIVIYLPRLQSNE